MALSSASAVSPTPAVDNTAKANTSVAANGNGGAGTFTDSLDAVLAQAGTAAAKSSADTGKDSNVALFASLGLAKLKGKLKNSDATIAIAPQALQQQQAILQSLNAANTGIDMPALRGAMGKGASAPGNAHILPVLDPVTGKVSVASPVAKASAAGTAAATSDAASTAAQATTPQGAALQDANTTATQTAAAQQATASPAPSATTQNSAATPSKASPKSSADSSQSAVTATTQEKLVASLIKTAKAPVLKSGQADGSEVPNAKIAPRAKADKTADTQTAQSMAAKIAATAAVTNPNDTAQTAAQGVAVAEVATRQAAATAQALPVTKIEAAAMTNATQTAVHTPASQAKIEAQALPVQFDAQSLKQDGNADTQSGANGKGQGHPDNAHTANDASRQTAAPDSNLADPQLSAPTTASTSTTPANTDVATNAATGVSAPATPATIATTLQVSQQTQHSAPSDQATFAALGVAIAAKSKDGEKQFDINMHPAELGRVDVRISVDADGKAQAHLSAEHPQTLQLLQNDKATLERNLRDAGLDVANNGLSFSLKGEQQSSTPTFNARSRALSIATVQTADVSSTNSSSSIAPGDSRLDIRV